jgi:hypothetical protein
MAPQLTGLTPSTDTGVSSSDGITTVSQPTLVGLAEPGSTVQVFANSTLAATTMSDATGHWAVTFESPLAEGEYSLSARATDVAGNISATSTPYFVVIDPTSPTPPQIDGITPETDTGVVGDGATTVTTPSVRGRAEANNVVQVFANGKLLGSTVADDAGSWRFAVPTPLALGKYALEAKSVDIPGNQSTLSPSYGLVIQAP